MVWVSVRYDSEDENGETRRDRNQRFGVHPGPEAEVPPTCDHIWQWFCDLSACRSHADSGPQPISHQEIQAWSRLTGQIITPEEVDILRAMDKAFLREMSRERRAAMDAQKQEQPKAKPRMVSG